jgi:hypothetical protein
MASQIAARYDYREADHEQHAAKQMNIDDDRDHAGYDQPVPASSQILARVV